ncbi:carbonate dehydratase [Streptomyces viridochromogenes DSM 40736]|uniref:Carbonate dehydratase n=1 Tax=Streptomyces viridochromogenes (strain DSM 40736 / JCM 4977 / BCRC 1201 / Tue 494) TaxID=591159 RepID=D9XG43_STRVT|nr:carbonic anhydrase [Streptomyces viridochromogenes]EFL36932.1 carbonate dehydratase [Streptomyces viridochromogenes DSM 40736]
MNSHTTSHRGSGPEPHSFAGSRPTPGGTVRRTLLRTALTGAAALGAGFAAAPQATATTSAPGTPPRPGTPDEALRELAEGNRRWRAYRERHPHEDPALRRTLATAQHPFAVVLGCIDSRVPPELVFDQGLGDLMTVRTAGEVLDEAVLGSVAYGVLELAIPLVVVLGHQSCGAVRAAVQAEQSGERLPAHMQYLVDQIGPAIDHGVDGDARIDATVSANVRLVRSRLAAEPELAARVADGRLAIVGARYELTTQTVHRVA